VLISFPFPRPSPRFKTTLTRFMLLMHARQCKECKGTWEYDPAGNDNQENTKWLLNPFSLLP
jgi:uncharacterized protein YhhL (DUF1145 family)